MARLLRNVSILKRSLCYLEDSKRCLLGSLSSQINSFSTKGKKKLKSDSSDSGDEIFSKKDLALKQATDQINTSNGKGSIMFLGQCASPRQVLVVSTRSFALDIALEIGGFPKERVVEIYGPKASGKITLGSCTSCYREAQKQGGISRHMMRQMLLPLYYQFQIHIPFINRINVCNL